MLSIFKINNGRLFFGFVASYYWDDDKRKKFYNIKYDDSDKEDVLDNELLQMIQLYEEEKHND